MTWLRAHWKLCALLASHLGVGAAGWVLHPRPPAPAVQLRQDTAQKSDAASRAAVHDEKGAAKITTVVEEFEPPEETRAEGRGALGTAYPPSAAVRPQDLPDSNRATLGSAANVPERGPLVKRTVTVEERGPEVIDSHTSTQAHEETHQHLDLTVTPPRPPRWALGAGMEDPLGARRVSLTAGMRLVGPVWLRAGLAPARGLGSATVGLEVTF